LKQAKALEGRHNWQNAAAAFAAVSSFGLDPKEIGKAILTFPGLAHRMETVGTLRNVRFVNDSKATNADAARQALASYKNIFWIAGGVAKEGGIEPLSDLFENVASAYLIGDAAEEFASTLSDGKRSTQISKTLKMALLCATKDALESGLENPIVLLSPACASFDQFKNFEVRGDAFRVQAPLIMLALPFIGYEVKGAVRWVRIGPLGLQPSEFAKPAFIVFAAWMFSIRHRDPNVPSVAIVFATYGALVALLISQPDFGQSFLLTLGFAAVFFFAGLSLGWLLIMLGISLIGVVVAYFTLGHVRDRVNSFLSPNTSDSFQIDKSLEAISSGGFWGRGPGEGKVKYSLPDGNTDFIFAVTVEEFGFLISTILIILLAAFVIQTFRNALRLNDYFCQLAAAGLATLVGMQTIINLYVNLNMAPSKGMTLPFISNGGSSMLALCFTAGLILAFTRRRPGAYEYGR